MIVSIDPAFARAYFTPHAAGVYAAAAVLGKAVLWLPAVITQLVFSHLAEQSAKEQDATHLPRRAVLVILGISGAAVVGLYVLGGPVCTLLYGDRYDSASDIAWKIGLAMLPLTIVNLLIYQVIACGQNRFLVGMAIAAIGEVAALFFVPMTGNSYAVTIGAVGLAALLLMLARGPE